MSDFKFQQKINGSDLTIALSGKIEEGALLPNVTDDSVKKIFFDLKDLTAISSLGIREWIKWIHPLSSKYQLFVLNCPRRIVTQFNMVEGFLPPGTKIISLYVPFYCEKCDFEKTILYNLEEAMRANNGDVPAIDFDINKIKECKDEHCELELDISKASYFKFLKN